MQAESLSITRALPHVCCGIVFAKACTGQSALRPGPTTMRSPLAGGDGKSQGNGELGCPLRQGSGRGKVGAPGQWAGKKRPKEDKMNFRGIPMWASVVKNNAHRHTGHAHSWQHTLSRRQFTRTAAGAALASAALGSGLWKPGQAAAHPWRDPCRRWSLSRVRTRT
jgi:hypothetical protein